MKVVVRGVALAVCLAARLAHAQDQPVIRLDPEFESEITLEQIRDAALTMLSRPVTSIVPSDAGEVTVHPPRPVIHEIIGCRGADLPSLAPGVAAVELPWVWLVTASGSFSFVGQGTIDDAEGYLLVHPRSGAIFRWGALPKERD